VSHAFVSPPPHRAQGPRARVVVASIPTRELRVYHPPARGRLPARPALAVLRAAANYKALQAGGRAGDAAASAAAKLTPHSRARSVSPANSGPGRSAT